MLLPVLLLLTGSTAATVVVSRHKQKLAQALWGKISKGSAPAGKEAQVVKYPAANTPSPAPQGILPGEPAPTEQRIKAMPVDGGGAPPMATPFPLPAPVQSTGYSKATSVPAGKGASVIQKGGAAASPTFAQDRASLERLLGGSGEGTKKEPSASELPIFRAAFPDA
jgi:hypothetical protein